MDAQSTRPIKRAVQKFVKITKQPSEKTIELVQLIADGMTNYEIAYKIGLSVRTIESNIHKIKIDFHALNSPNLVTIFFRKNLIK